MKNCALAIILVVAASVYSDAAPDHLMEAHHVPSSYRGGTKWELGSASHVPLNVYKSAPTSNVQSPQVGVHYPAHTQYGVHHTTYNEVPVHQPVNKCAQQPVHQTVFKHVQHPVHQPIVAHVQQPVHQTIFRHVEQPAHEPIAAHIQQPVHQPIISHVQQPVHEPIISHVQHPVYRQAGVLQTFQPHGLQQRACLHV